MVRIRSEPYALIRLMGEDSDFMSPRINPVFLKRDIEKMRNRFRTTTFRYPEWRFCAAIFKLGCDHDDLVGGQWADGNGEVQELVFEVGGVAFGDNCAVCEGKWPCWGGEGVGWEEEEEEEGGGDEVGVVHFRMNFGFDVYTGRAGLY